ncbi:MAG: type IV pilin protein [Bdellovibrio sp.]
MFLPSGKKSQSGFSLVELMVVVAIIGILASIAIPSVNKYMAKARQSEAKTNLSSLYTSEKAFYAEYTIYDDRFAVVGYTPEGQLRYNVGFVAGGSEATQAANGYSAPAPTNANVSASAYCAVANSGCVILNGATNVAPPAIADSMCTAGGTSAAGASCTTQGGTFRAASAARIQSTNGQDDWWTIDDGKTLRNTQSGIQ